MRTRLEKWEQECSTAKEILLNTNSLSKKITHYYNSPLEIVSEGALYLEELKNASEFASQNLITKIREVRVSVDTQLEEVI